MQLIVFCCHQQVQMHQSTSCPFEMVLPLAIIVVSGICVLQIDVQSLALTLRLGVKTGNWVLPKFPIAANTSCASASYHGATLSVFRLLYKA